MTEANSYGPANRSLLLCLIPWFACFLLMLRYRYDAPYWDQWWNVVFIEKAFDGTLRLRDLWLTVNEHRVFFPNLVFVWLAKATRWSHFYENALSFLVATASFGIILLMLRRSERLREAPATLWPAPLMALLFFSWTQWQNWMWGFHLMIFMAALSCVAVSLLLSHRPLGWPRFAGAVICAIVASYSVGAGLAAWPVGLALLNLTRTARSHVRLQLILWGLCAAATIAFYFYGYQSAGEASVLDAFQHPLAFTLYAFSYLGSPLVAFHGSASAVAGAMGLAASGFFIWRSLRGGQREIRRAALPWIGLILTACAVAVLTAAKHWPEGPAQALSSRYVTWATLLWVGLLGLVHVHGVWPGRNMSVALAICVFMAAVSFAFGLYEADESHDAFLIGRRALVTGDPSEALRWLYPDPAFALEKRAVLVAYNLSVFR